MYNKYVFYGIIACFFSCYQLAVVFSTTMYQRKFNVCSVEHIELTYNEQKV